MKERTEIFGGASAFADKADEIRVTAGGRPDDIVAPAGEEVERESIHAAVFVDADGSFNVRSFLINSTNAETLIRDEIQPDDPTFTLIGTVVMRPKHIKASQVRIISVGEGELGQQNLNQLVTFAAIYLHQKDPSILIKASGVDGSHGVATLKMTLGELRDIAPRALPRRARPPIG